MEYVNHKFQFAFQEMIEKLPDEEKVELIEALSCEDAIIKHVMDQVLDTCTENGWHGAKSGGGSVEVYSPLDVARRRIAEGASKVSEEQIAALKRALKAAEERAAEGWSKYHDLANRYRATA